jgi:GrpB-like predicted nucleotidyltransferase (UPF0157 family)
MDVIKEVFMSKRLMEMTNEERWQLFPIILKPYNPEYQIWYRDEAKYLRTILGNEIIERMNHIGSTSVHGLLAKPTIDILFEVKDEKALQYIRDHIESHAYICLNQVDAFKNPSLLCMKGYLDQGFAEKVFHVHVRIINNHKELYFRDYLRDHPQVAQEYADLKIKLMKKYKHHRDNYTDKKSDFINHYTTIAKQIYPNRYQSK